MPPSKLQPQFDPAICFPKFWMVLNDNPERCANPTYRHHTEESARKEAARLANNNPGVLYYVLEATAACRKADVEWQTGVDRATLPF